MHVDAHPTGVLPPNDHLSLGQTYTQWMPLSTRLPGTLGVLHVHLCKIITTSLIDTINCNRNNDFIYNHLHKPTRGRPPLCASPCTTPSPTAWLTFGSFFALVAQFHCAIRDATCNLDRSTEAMQRTELCKGSAPDDKCSILHEHDKNQSITQSCHVLSTSKFSIICLGVAGLSHFILGLQNPCKMANCMRQGNHPFCV